LLFAVSSTSKLALLDAEEEALEGEEEAEAVRRRRDGTTKNAHVGIIHRCFGVADVTRTTWLVRLCIRSLLTGEGVAHGGRHA